MESTKHPDQNPENAPMQNQDENSTQENPVSTIEDSSSTEVNAEEETETQAPAEIQPETEIAAESDPTGNRNSR